MNNFLAKHQLLIVCGVVGVFAIIVFVSFFTFSGTPPESPESEKPLATPTFNPDSLQADHPIPGGRYQYSTPEDDKIMSDDAKIGMFISELPYLGRYVRVDYSYSDNTFLVRMDPDNIEKAEEEYAALLKDKGITERIKVYNVDIRRTI